MNTHEPELPHLVSTVRKALNKYHLRNLIVGLSGGADSTALLTAFASIRDEERVELTAVHCNFHLRGAESDRDEKFCRELCESLGVEVRVFQCPVAELRETHKGSDEMVCREVRYDIFRTVMAEKEADAIAIAHNADDQAETFLLNLMRGAGSTGLKGMSKFANGIFRPMLDLSRSDILAYLKSIGGEFVTDSTNLDSVYRRNFLRNKLIPLLEEEWPEAKRSINRSAEILSREHHIIEWTLERLLPSGAETLSRKLIATFPDPESLFRRLLLPHGASAALIHEIALTSTLPYSGRSWDLPDGKKLLENRDGWEVGEMEPMWASTLQKEELAFIPLLMDRILRAPLNEFWADAAILFEWRVWRKGDRIRPLGMRGSRLVSDVLTEAKISQAVKNTFHVLALPASNEVIWIPGIKRSRLHLVEKPNIVARYFVI